MPVKRSNIFLNSDGRNMIRGFCIQFAGVNNIGKSTQIGLLADWLTSRGVVSKTIKFPMYDLGERGVFIQRYLKDKSFREAYRQQYADAEQLVARAIIENHHDFEPQLGSLLAEGIWVIIEGSVIDSLAWSQVNGITYAEAKELHDGLTLGDVEILLHENQGRRFLEAQEAGHVNEEDEARIEEARSHMLALVEDNRFCVERVNFVLEESREAVSAKVLQALSKRGLLVNLPDFPSVSEVAAEAS